MSGFPATGSPFPGPEEAVAGAPNFRRGLGFGIGGDIYLLGIFRIQFFQQLQQIFLARLGHPEDAATDRSPDGVGNEPKQEFLEGRELGGIPGPIPRIEIKQICRRDEVSRISDKNLSDSGQTYSAYAEIFSETPTQWIGRARQASAGPK